MEFKVFLIANQLYDMDDSPTIRGYIVGTAEDAEAYCAELNKDVEYSWDKWEWEELDCLNPEKLSAFLDHKSISSDTGA